MFTKKEEEKNIEEPITEKENSKIKKYLIKKLTPKIRYEFALRYGIFLVEKGKNIDIKGIEHLEKDNAIQEVDDEELQELIEEAKINNSAEDNMGIPLSSDDALKIINLANEKHKKVGLEAGKELGNFLNNLSIATVYMRHNLTVEDNKLLKKKNFIKEANLKIIDNGIKKSYKKFNADYFIRFLDVIYSKYGENININAMYKIIEQICISDQNEELLEFVQETLTKFGRIEPEGISNIISTLQDKAIFKTYQENYNDRFDKNQKTIELMENQEERNIKLHMIRDIVNSIDFEIDDEQDFIDFINNVSDLSPEKLQEYWLNFSEERTNIKTANERLNRYKTVQNKQKETNIYEVKRKLKKPDTTLQKYGEKKGKQYKRAKIAGIALGLIVGSTVITNGIDSVMSRGSINKEIYINDILPLPIADDKGRLIFESGEKAKIRFNIDKSTGTIESQDGKKVYNFNTVDIKKNGLLKSILDNYVKDETEKQEKEEER